MALFSNGPSQCNTCLADEGSDRWTHKARTQVVHLAQRLNVHVIHLVGHVVFEWEAAHGAQALRWFWFELATRCRFHTRTTLEYCERTVSDSSSGFTPKNVLTCASNFSKGTRDLPEKCEFHKRRAFLFCSF